MLKFVPVVLLGIGMLPTRAETVLVEAESFLQPGGWVLDTQFIDLMGSPYLLAHGLGQPVADAIHTFKLPVGVYRVWARTKDWVAPFGAAGAPGKFQVLVNGKPLSETLGTTGAEWHWQLAGKFELKEGGPVGIALHDLTGFAGRCDALVFSSDPNFSPPSGKELEVWRKKELGFPETAPETEVFDLVVCGGGYSGVAAALSAARQGLKVALIQNRPVLGGNGSSEVRVWAQGGTRRGLYPTIGEIVEEFADRAKNSPGTQEEFGDLLKEQIVRAEKNIELLLGMHVWGVTMEPGDRKIIQSVTAMNVKTGAELRVRGKLFVDCTGHGSVGALAQAEFFMLEKGHLGMSNMWYWRDAEAACSFPKTEWALPLELGDFPITKKAEGDSYHKGEWFWESGFDKHPINDLELVRDHNFRAVFGAFNALKNGPEAAKYAKARLEWVAYIGGTRESRLLRGDVVLTDKDILERKEFPDACVPTTWDLDLHYPKEQYAKKFPDNPFISRAVFGSGVDKKDGYPIPYRCFYSKNVENLFMAGRCVSVTHEALGTVRVMRTCGMMGEVVGKAAYLCVLHQTTPRGVYQSHLAELKELWKLPGAARREKLGGEVKLPEKPVVFPPSAGDKGRSPQGIDPTKLGGIVIDDNSAKLTGEWTEGTGLAGFVGRGYRYTTGGSDSTATYTFTVPKDGRYEVRIAWQPHPNRSKAVPCEINNGTEAKPVTLNQQEAPKVEPGFTSVGVFTFAAGKEASVQINAKNASGHVHADAVWIVEASDAK